MFTAALNGEAPKPPLSNVSRAALPNCVDGSAANAATASSYRVAFNERDCRLWRAKSAARARITDKSLPVRRGLAFLAGTRTQTIISVCTGRQWQPQQQGVHYTVMATTYATLPRLQHAAECEKQGKPIANRKRAYAGEASLAIRRHCPQGTHVLPWTEHAATRMH